MKSTVIPIILSTGIAHATVYYKDIKRLNLRVKGKDIMISAPIFTSMKSIESFVAKNVPWIESRLDLNSDDNIYYLGKKYDIEVKAGKSHVEITDGRFTVCSPDGTVDSAKKVLLRWWKKRAKEEFISQSMEIYEEVKRAYKIKEYPQIILSSAHGYWGKCFYQRNEIKYSYYLLQADRDTIKYVIYHEFAHIDHHGHDQAFYDAVRLFYPDVKGAKKRLKNYSTVLWFDD